MKRAPFSRLPLRAPILLGAAAALVFGAAGAAAWRRQIAMDAALRAQTLARLMPKRGGSGAGSPS